jgi:hypothetical protein
MNALAHLRAIAADPTGTPHTGSTARGIIEARLGRKLTRCLRTLKREEPDTYHALRRLAIELVRNRRTTA